MPTDAKCGLLVGVGLVVAAAVTFFQKEPPPGSPPGSTAPPAAVRAPVPSVPADRTRLPSPPPARPTDQGIDRP